MASGKEASRIRSRRSFAQMPRHVADKENTTSDIGSVTKSQIGGDDDAAQAKRNKKLRSKSLGPGGLDSLTSGAGNRRKSTIQFPLKSILKPAVPVSPVQNIPSFEETRRRTPGRTPQQPRHSTNPATGDLIDFSTPTSANHASQSNPFDSFSPVGIPLRTEEEQQAAAREREERERQEQKRQALEHREARRKSLANRRVSFAPEATLHTWNVVEANDDSTTSSASNSTRQESQFGDNTTHNAASSDPIDPSTPDHESHDSQLSTSSLDNVEEYEAFSSSPYGSVAADETNVVEEGSDSESDPGDTVMSLDNVTEHSPSSSNQSTTNLDENLRKAAQEAGTRGIDFDENGDLSMEFTEIQGAFQPWIKKGGGVNLDDMSTRFGQEDLAFEQPLAEAGHAGSDQTADMDFTTGEISMDMTNALGQIIQRQTEEFTNEARTPPDNAPDPDQTQATNVGDQTMDFTGVIGGITQGAQNDEPESSPFKPMVFDNNNANDGDATMEFTSVFGNSSINKGRQWDDFEADDDQQSNHDVTNYTYTSGFGDDDMDMTHAMGGILSPIVEQTEPQDDLSFTTKMDMTNAIGKILPAQQSHEEPQIATQESAVPSIGPQPAASNGRRHSVTRVSESGSPMRMSPLPAPHTPGGFPETQEATTPQQSLPETPVENPTTPGNETTTPRDAVPTPQDETPIVNSSKLQEQPLYPTLPREMEAEQDEKGDEDDTQQREEKQNAPVQETPEQVTPQQKTPLKHSSLFIEDGHTGQATPSFILRPQSRKSSGLGIDRQGLGSPKVAELLDRRRSIGDEAESFSPAIPPSRGVRFDPQEMEKEIEKEQQAEEEARQSERGATSNLKNLIQSMSPKKKPVKMARKSLHVGSAVGLLGKRPAELDVDSDDEDEPTPKRLRGREASPVKSVRLPAPPSKDQTTGRLGFRPNLFPHSPGPNASTTPKGAPGLPPPSPSKKAPIEPSQDSSHSNEEISQQSPLESNYKPIHLQDFLDMTNIRFMELTTTKRRHTVAPKDKPRTSRDNPEKEVTFADRVVASATTLPLLEMYQHSCRELKNYISEGRNIIHSIEEETFAENPPLFREYISAPPDVRALMDNQFRNVKMNARLQSKAMWYEWRMKLLDGLKQGLDKHLEDMKHDEEVISKKEVLVNGVLPQALEERAKLEEQVEKMRQKVNELQSADREAILALRKELLGVDKRLTERREELDSNKTQHDEMSDTLRSAAEMKADLLKDIQEGERLLAERRACGIQEMRQLKAAVRALEKQSGWCILSVHGEPDSELGPCMVIRYRDELRVKFYPKAFSDQSPTTYPSITFDFAPDSRDINIEKEHPTPVKSLVLSSMREKLADMPLRVRGISSKDFLKGIARDWNRATSLDEEVQYLRFCGATRIKIMNESRLRVRCMLTSSAREQQPSIVEDDRTPDKYKSLVKSRVDIDLVISSKVVDDREVDVDVNVTAVAVYGIEQAKTKQMTEFLTKTIAQGRDQVTSTRPSRGIWRDAIRKCEKRIF